MLKGSRVEIVESRIIQLPSKTVPVYGIIMLSYRDVREDFA
jgi:hypothetical protein